MDGTAFSVRFSAHLHDVRRRIVKPSYAIASLAMLLSVVQCGTRSVSNPRIPSNDEEPPELRELRRQGNALLRASHYPQAISIYENGYREAQRRRSPASAIRFLNNLGTAYYQLFRYRDAIQTYLKARD